MKSLLFTFITGIDQMNFIEGDLWGTERLFVIKFLHQIEILSLSLFNHYLKH